MAVLKRLAGVDETQMGDLSVPAVGHLGAVGGTLIFMLGFDDDLFGEIHAVTAERFDIQSREQVVDRADGR